MAAGRWKCWVASRGSTGRRRLLAAGAVDREGEAGRREARLCGAVAVLATDRAPREEAWRGRVPGGR